MNPRTSLVVLCLALGSWTNAAAADTPKKGQLPVSFSYRGQSGAPNACAEYVAKGGPLAGVIISPMIAGGGIGLAVAGGRNTENGKLTDAGRGMLAGGIVMAVVGLAASIASGKRLQKRKKQRRAQMLAGCPPY